MPWILYDDDANNNFFKTTPPKILIEITVAIGGVLQMSGGSNI
jgi:hypothetical protein